MCKAEGMAISPWGSLGGGYFKTDSERVEKQANNTGRHIPVMDTANHGKVGKVLQELGRLKGVHMTSIALAYVMHKRPYVFPVIGCRKVEHVRANMDGLKVELTARDMELIENAGEFDIGFPMNFNGGANPKHNPLLHNTGHYDYVDDVLVCFCSPFSTRTFNGFITN
jgi:aryl-alcohol dehydrogenase-like predicted oxidoreductase